jgi:ERCC4-type nuclease
MSQVELRTLIAPGIKFYQKIFGDYYELCKDLGFINKYIYPDYVKINSPRKLVKGAKIFIDSREQKPLKFNLSTEIAALKFADYSYSLNENIYFERKTISDLIGTLSGGHDRFCREIEKAGDANSKLIIIVEEKFSNAQSFNYLPHVYKKDTRVTPEFIFHIVRELIQEYPFIQFLFVEGRKEAVRVIEKIYTSSEDITKYDLQLAYDLDFL